MDPLLNDLTLTALSLGLPEAASPVSAMAVALRVAHAGDAVRYPASVALLRSLRRSRILRAPGLWRDLSRNAAFISHAALEGRGDPLFFLSHRHYLARGLTPAQRIRAAATHYRHEVSVFRPEALNAIHRGEGLRLWDCQIDGAQHDIVLMRGNDVAHEGGLSLVLRISGERVCVLSFSFVPLDCVMEPVPAAQGDPILFVTRKQLTPSRSHQTAFNRHFDRASPASLALGALRGLAGALGYARFAAIAGVAQPAWAPQFAEGFRHSYEDFWPTLGGKRVSARAFLVPVPPALPPLDSMNAMQRKRARARRRQTDAVEAATRALLAPLLLGPAAS